MTTDHLRPAMPFLPEPLQRRPGRPGRLGRRARATCSSRGSPRTASSTSAIEGHPGAARRRTTSPASSCTPTCGARGWFRCSDDRINRLHEAAVWSFRGNACDIPTDCPHPRARRLDRRLAAVRADRDVPLRRRRLLHQVAARPRRRPVGRTAPSPTWRRCRAAERQRLPERPLNGSAGWGDAVVLVPWEIYQEYGDLALLAELWPTMVALARPGRADGRRASGTPTGWPRSAEPRAARAVPLGHRLPLGRVARARRATRATSRPSSPPTRATSRPRSTPGRPGTRPAIAAAARPRRRRRPVRRAQRRASCDAWRAEFLDADGRVTPAHPGQPGPGAALRPGPRRAARSRPPTTSPTLVREAGTHLGTGFLATPDLLPVLADHGHLDLAYELLLPGHRAVVADDDRPRRHHGVGALGGHRRRRRAARVAQPLLQGRGDLVPAPVRRRAAAARADLAPVPGAAASRRRDHLGARRAPDPARAASRRLAAGRRGSRSPSPCRRAASPRWCCPTAPTEVGPGTHAFSLTGRRCGSCQC